MAIKKFNAVTGFSVGLDDYIIDVVDANANVSATNLTVTANSILGSAANVKITGGSSGFVLKTDGTGNLSWADQSAGGTNSYVQFNDNGLFNGVSSFTFDKNSNQLTLAGNLQSQNANLGNLATANYFTGTLTTHAQPNITSVGTLTSLAVTGNVTAGNLSGTLVTGTLTTNAQPNITSVGDLTSLNVTGNVTAGNLSGTLVTGTLTTNAQPNVTSVGTLTSLAVTGNITAGNVTGATLVSATRVQGTLTTSAQPNITSLGTLTSLSVNGNTDIIGNLNVTGNITYLNSNVTYLVDPIIEQGGLANGGVLLSDDTHDRGQLLHYFDETSNSAIDAFSGWKNASSEFIFASNVQVTDNIVTVREYGNIRANVFFGSFSGTASLSTLQVSGNVTAGNISGGNLVTANYLTGTLTTHAQPNITSVGTLTGLTVDGSDLTITNANLHISTAGKGIFVDNLYYANGVAWDMQQPTGSEGQIQFNKNSNFGASANLVFDDANSALQIGGNLTTKNANLGNLATANFFSGDGYKLSNITGANVTGQVAFSAVANLVAGANVTGQVSNALVAATVYSSAQPNITSVGDLASLNVIGNLTTGNLSGTLITGTLTTSTQPNITSVGALTSLTVTGDITAANANLGNAVTANYFLGNGSLLTGVLASGGAAATVSASAQPNITSVGTLTSLNVAGSANLGSVANLHVTGGSNGYYLKTDGTGNLSWDTTKAYIDSNITNVVAGSAIGVEMDYTDVTYPSGKFKIYQMGPVSLTVTDTWSSGSATKNAYANSLAGTVNTLDITLNLSLANASFSVQTTDTITLGGNVSITGATLLAIGISGTGGTYTIPNAAFSTSTIETRATSTVAVSLTTSRGVYNSSGTTLVATQPVAFTLNSLTASFPSSTVPYWNLNQAFNWSASITGTVASGNLTYTGGAGGTLTTTGATSGSSSSLDSTVTYTLSTSDYTGAGLYGYGTRTIPATVTKAVTPATIYYPIFWKTTSSSSNPNFTTSDSHNTINYALGQGANTTATTSDYLWIAIKASTGSHTFAFTFLSAQATITPDATYTNQTIGGEVYNVYGFTNANQVTFIYTIT